jgi:hypothetical protein
MGKGIVKLGGGQWAVKDGNLLAVKESNSRFLNTEFTVTRGTRATYVGRDGLMKESNLQDTNLVLNGDFEELGSELVTDGNFPSGTTAWSFVGGSELTSDGARINNTVTGINSYAAQTLTGSLSGKQFVLTYDVITTNGKTLALEQASSSSLNTSTTGINRKLYFTWDRVNNGFVIKRLTTGTDVTVDNVSVKQVDPNDRWTLSSEWSISDGKLKGLGSGAYGIVSQAISGITSKKLKLTFEISDYVTGTFRVSPDHRADGLDIRYSGNGTHEVYYEAAHEIFKFQMQEFEGSIDNVSVQEIKTATPRVDFTGNTDGRLLLEPQRTNLITYSEDFSQSAWQKSNITATPNSIISPDGTLNAYKLTKPTSSTPRLFELSVYPSTGVHTFTSFYKNLDGDSVLIRLDGGGNTANCTVDLTTNTLVNSGANIISSNITQLSDGWIRVSVTANILSTSWVLDAVNLFSLSVGSSVYIWGAQLEAGSYATSYIPTHGSTVTRAADTCGGAGTSQDFNSAEGVLFVEMALLSDEDNNKYISISDGTDDNKIHIDFDYSLSRLQYVVKNETDVQVNLKLPYTGTNMDKIAVKWKVNDFAVWLNGVEIGTDTSGLAPIGLNTLNFSSSGSNHFQGKVKQLQVYKEALNSTRLIHLTGELGTDFYESYAEMASALTYTIQ